MKLIIYENYKINIADELLLIKPFRKMLLQDRSKTKERFLEKVSYIFFMYDPRSNYKYLTDLKERKDKIILQEGLPKNFKPDKVMLEAIEAYKDMLVTTSSLVLDDMREALNKIRIFLKEIDLNIIDERGKPIYTINSVTAALKQLPELAFAVEKAEKELNKEVEERSRMKGAQSKTTLTDEGIGGFL